VPDVNAFAHDAVLVMESGGDPAAPGGAITVALCGHWEHEPPCPFAPHHTAATQEGDEVHLRTLFVVEPARESVARERIDAALRRGRLVGPDGRESRWRVRASRASAVRPDELGHARRMAGA
jgi:hypothetical protein